MDVVKDNFDEAMKLYEKALSKCDFVSIDTELSGIQNSTRDRVQAFDTPEDYYQKQRESAKCFSIVQYGICTFKWDAKRSRYIAMPFNFNVFSSSNSMNFSTERVFNCQASSLTFLANNNFSFDKWVKQGIGYLSLSDEERLKKNIGPYVAKGGDVQITEELKVFLQGIWEKVQKFVDDGEQQLVLDASINGFQRKIIFQELPKKFEGLHVESVQLEGSHYRQLVITKMSKEQQVKREQENVLKAQNDLKAAVGFRRAIDLLREAKKPVIGHNLFLDLVQTYEKFYKPCPQTSEEFKKEISEIFPIIFDTKYIATKAPEVKDSFFMSTALSDVHNVVTSDPDYKQPTIVFADNDRYSSQDIYHEAGYDAYVTGVAFIRMCTRMQQVVKELHHQQLKANQTFAIDAEFLASLVNRLYMMQSDTHFNLAGPHEAPERSNVYVAVFPKETNTNQLVTHFSTFGQVRVRWINDTSAFITFDESPSAPVTGSDTIVVMSFDEYQQYKEQQRTEESSAKRKRALESPQVGALKKKQKLSGANFPEACIII